MTRQERSQQIGITIQTMANWERSGVDVWDDDQVRARISKMRNLPTGLKPEWLPVTPELGAVMDEDDPTQVDIEVLAQRLAACNDKHQAQTIKTQIDGLLNAYKLREAAGKYVSKVTVKESLIRIGAVFKAGVKRLEADLPPMLDGASPEVMKRIIGEKTDEMLRSLEDEYTRGNEG